MSIELTHDKPPRPFRELLAEVQGGSEEAAKELYDTYVMHVLRCVRFKMWHKLRTQFDSQDFVQQVWASFFFDRGRLPDFETPEDLVNYLLAMARNKVAMAARARQTQKRDVDLEVRILEEIELVGPHPPSRDPTPSAIAIGAEQHERLVIDQPPPVRAVAELRMEGRTFDEIAAKLEMDESTARRKMRELREQIDE